MNDSEVVVGNGYTVYSGPDGVNLARAISVKAALRLAMAGLTVRGTTKTGLLKIASEYTGKKYKRGAYQEAREDLQVWIENMKLALPIKDER
jgi:hypothetical protein